MSRTIHVYAGPFLRCRAAFEERQAGTARRCVTLHCPGGTLSGRYCPHCGKEGVGTLTMRKVRTHEPYDLTAGALCSVGQDDFPEEWDFVIPNVSRGQPRNFELETGDRLALHDADPVGECGWLEKAFAPELAILRDAYGADAVEMCWGVLVYSM